MHHHQIQSELNRLAISSAIIESIPIPNNKSASNTENDANSLLGKTLNSEILKNSSGGVRVAKKKFGSGRVAGTRQGLYLSMERANRKRQNSLHTA